MKTNIILIILIAAIILIGCGGTPVAVDRFGNTQPVIIVPAVTPSSSETLIYDSNSLSFLPSINPNGSVTLFRFNDFQVVVLPYTDNRTRSALSITTGEYDSQIAQYTRALEANPDDYDACIMLAGIYINRGLPGDAAIAIDYSNRALAISNDNPEALYARGLAHSENGQSQNALNDLTAVLRTNIQSMKGVYYLMGMIQFRAGDIDEAIESFEKVRTIDPDFVDVNRVLAILYTLQ